jgi:hypothetical protein
MIATRSSVIWTFHIQFIGCRSRDVVARPRIFRKIDGRWQMIHPHVSFPVDPTSGAAKVDLRP